MRAEILTIGTELLLGEIVDTNTAELARALRGIGADLYRTTTVGDNIERIAQAVQEALERSDVLLTTGGLGPTVDDPTREGIALALEVPLEFHDELWQQIRERFARFRRRPTENNRRQAFLPQGARALENHVGTAPAFWAEWRGKVVVALPGVPAEMRYLLLEKVLPLLKARFPMDERIEVLVLRTAGVGESWLDEKIQDVERLANPTVGVSAHPGRVDIRIAAKGKGPDEVRALIAPIEKQIRSRLGDAIYGEGSSTLEAAVVEKLRARAWRAVTLEAGTLGALADILKEWPEVFSDGGRVDPGLPPEEWKARIAVAMAENHAQAGMGLEVEAAPSGLSIHIYLASPSAARELERNYGGPPDSAIEWAVSLALDALRRMAV